MSQPVRTQFGYHLVYVQDKIPAIAKLYVSQIFIKDTNALDPKSDHSEAMRKAAEIRQEWKNGVSFDNLTAAYSDDAATRNSGGRMEPFSPNRRPGNYVYAAINLKNGEISEPVPSVIGWHILRLDSVVYTTVNDEFKYMLKNRLARDSRSKKSKESLVEKLKTEYNYEEKGKAGSRIHDWQSCHFTPRMYRCIATGNLRTAPKLVELVELELFQLVVFQLRCEQRSGLLDGHAFRRLDRQLHGRRGD